MRLIFCFTPFTDAVRTQESNITTLKSVFSILDTVASVGNKGDAVVFYYYQGLYLMDSKQQAKAATVFLKAFRLCPASSVNNRRYAVRCTLH